jgi:cysteine synthase A
MRLAKDLGPGHTVVTILADSGTRYQSKLFNPAFLKGKGLPCPTGSEHPHARRVLESAARSRRA